MARPELFWISNQKILNKEDFPRLDPITLLVCFRFVLRQTDFRNDLSHSVVWYLIIWLFKVHHWGSSFPFVIFLISRPYDQTDFKGASNSSPDTQFHRPRPSRWLNRRSSCTTASKDDNCSRPFASARNVIISPLSSTSLLPPIPVPTPNSVSHPSVISFRIRFQALTNHSAAVGTSTSETMSINSNASLIHSYLQSNVMSSIRSTTNELRRISSSYEEVNPFIFRCSSPQCNSAPIDMFRIVETNIQQVTTKRSI